MANSVLAKFLKTDSFNLPCVLPTSACMSENLTLKEALAKRQISVEQVPQQQNNVYLIVDSDGHLFVKGRVEKFIWDLWTDDDLEDDKINYSVLNSKLAYDTIPTKLSQTAIGFLIFFLYNGRFPAQAGFDNILELIHNLASLNLDKQLNWAMISNLGAVTSIENLRKAWQNGSFLINDDPTLLFQSVAYIICNPEKVFSGDDCWLEMPKEILQKLHPDVLCGLLGKLEEYGATADKRQTYSVDGKIYLRTSHFELFYFLVKWAKRYYQAVLDQKKKTCPSILNLRNILTSSIDIIDATKFDVSIISENADIEDGKTYIKYLNAYVILKNTIQYSKEQLQDSVVIRDLDFDLLPPVKQSVLSRADKTLCPMVVDRIQPQHSLSATQDFVQTTLTTVEMVSNIFGTVKLTDRTVLADNSGFLLHYHSYVVGLYKSVFTESYNMNETTNDMIELGGVTEDTVVNFFKSFYLPQEDILTKVTVDLEFCFLALLFQVDFLLESVSLFTEKNKSCVESRVMYCVSIYRRDTFSTGSGRLTCLYDLLKNLQRDILNVVQSVSFMFFFDETMVYDLLESYDGCDPVLYNQVIDELVNMSRIQKWLRKESDEEHETRLKIFETLRGIILLD